MSIFGTRDSGPKVVQDRLGLWYDYGQTVSYPRTGTIVTDRASNINATMNGAFTYYTGSGGYISDFQLFNSYTSISASYSATSLTGLTMQAMVMFTGNQYESCKIIASTNSGGNDFGLDLGPTTVGMASDGGSRQATVTFPQNQWVFVSGTRDTSTLSLSIRLNDGSRTTNTYASLNTVNFTNGWMFARSNGSSVQFIGRVAAVLFYTKALSSDEELQNFYAYRLRYGI